MQVIDTITADQIEENDLIGLTEIGREEIFEVVSVSDSGDEVVVVGDSLVTGDREEFVFNPYQRLDLLGA